MWWWRRRPKTLGQRGEALAAGFLKKQGFRILQQNLRIGQSEIDIVAQQGDEVVLVEVRTRSAQDGFAPEDSIGADKRRRMSQAMSRYLARYQQPGFYYRMDVIAVVLVEGEPPIITHYPDAVRSD